MKIIEKYTGEKTYMFPSGRIATKEVVLEKFPAALTFTHVVETDEAGQVMWALQNLAALKSIYNIDVNTSEEDAIAKLQEIVNAETEVAEVTDEVTTEERIAAALEYQNILTLAQLNSEE